jgi:hypothetical protein
VAVSCVSAAVHESLCFVIAMVRVSGLTLGFVRKARGHAFLHGALLAGVASDEHTRPATVVERREPSGLGSGAEACGAPVA